MNEELPEGYTVPVYRSLTQPVLVAGVPKAAAVTLGMTAALLVPVIFVKPSLLPYVGVIELLLYAAYRFAASCCKKDPYFFAVWFQNRGPSRYLP